VNLALATAKVAAHSNLAVGFYGKIHIPLATPAADFDLVAGAFN
jgi:hypothetical protein